MGKIGEIIALVIGIAAAFILVFGLSKIVARPAKKA
jgi:hypothetical protein